MLRLTTFIATGALVTCALCFVEVADTPIGEHLWRFAKQRRLVIAVEKVQASAYQVYRTAKKKCDALLAQPMAHSQHSAYINAVPQSHDTLTQADQDNPSSLEDLLDTFERRKRAVPPSPHTQGIP